MERPNPQLGTQNETTGERVLAWFADTIIIVLISVVLGWATSSFTEFLNFPVFLGTWILGSFVYHTALEATYGQTLGKRGVNIVVVKEDGDPCDWGASVIRNVVRVVDSFLFYLVGMAVILLSSDDQRLGDIAANTIVTEVAPEPEPEPDHDFLIELHHDEDSGGWWVELKNDSGEAVDLSRGELLADSVEPHRFPQDEAPHSPGTSKTYPVPEEFGSNLDSGRSLTLRPRTGERYVVRWNGS